MAGHVLQPKQNKQVHISKMLLPKNNKKVVSFAILFTNIREKRGRKREREREKRTNLS